MQICADDRCIFSRSGPIGAVLFLSEAAVRSTVGFAGFASVLKISYLKVAPAFLEKGGLSDDLEIAHATWSAALSRYVSMTVPIVCSQCVPPPCPVLWARARRAACQMRGADNNRK